MFRLMRKTFFRNFTIKMFRYPEVCHASNKSASLLVEQTGYFIAVAAITKWPWYELACQQLNNTYFMC